MVQALQHERSFDPSIWHKDPKDESWERRRTRPRPASPATSSAKKRNADRSAPRVDALLKAASALSEREDLTEHAGTLAEFLGVSRERLYSMTLAELIERHESAQLTEEINKAYDEELEQEDEQFLADVRGYQGRVLNTED